MTPAILSRFDLVFVVLDSIDEEVDFQIAKTILDAQEGIIKKTYLSEDEIKEYLKAAKELQPVMTREAADAI